jgi:hypothetical protein
MVHSDLIFVLAGKENRKEYAVKLFSEGWAPKLLLSVARFDVRRFSQLAMPKQLDLPKMAAKLSPKNRHFFVLIEGEQTSVWTIPWVRFGTLREILALRTWLGEHHQVRSVSVVSSGFHLKRVRMCCHSVLPSNVQVDFLGTTGDAKWEDMRLFRQVLAEAVKIPSYFVILRLAKRRGKKDSSTG